MSDTLKQLTTFDHPEPHTYRWSELELKFINDRCGKLQAEIDRLQAERDALKQKLVPALESALGEVMTDGQLRKAFEAAYFEACHATPRWSVRGWYADPNHQECFDWFKRGADLQRIIHDQNQ